MTFRTFRSCSPLTSYYTNFYTYRLHYEPISKPSIKMTRWWTWVIVTFWTLISCVHSFLSMLLIGFIRFCISIIGSWTREFITLVLLLIGRLYPSIAELKSFSTTLQTPCCLKTFVSNLAILIIKSSWHACFLCSHNCFADRFYNFQFISRKCHFALIFYGNLLKHR